MNIKEKISYLLLGFSFFIVILFYGCNHITPMNKIDSPKDAINKSAEEVGTASEEITKTSTEINKEASAIAEKTNQKDIIIPHTDAIKVNVIKQQEVAKNLDEIKVELQDSVKKTDTLEKDLIKERSARLLAEENSSKALKAKILGWSGFCFFGMLICGAITFFSKGNKIALYGGVVCAIGLAVCITLIQTITLIPWIVGGIFVIIFAIFVYNQFFKEKQIVNLNKTASELVKTVEVQKPFMTPESRKHVFGDGPVPGIISNIQGDFTKNVIEEIRADENFKKAVSVEPTEFIDLNKNGIDDRKEVLEVRKETIKII